MQCRGPLNAEFGEERVEGVRVLAGLAPDDLAGGVVADQGEVVVVLLPRHLVHPDTDQAVEAGLVQAVGDHPLADAPGGVPVDAGVAADRGLVHLRGQPGDEVVEVSGEPGAGAGERHRLGTHPVDGTAQAAQLRVDLDPPSAEVEVPPPRVHRAAVVVGPGAPTALRAFEALAAQRHRHDHPIRRRERHALHGDTRQVQQVVQ